MNGGEQAREFIDGSERPLSSWRKNRVNAVVHCDLRVMVNESHLPRKLRMR